MTDGPIAIIGAEGRLGRVVMRVADELELPVVGVSSPRGAGRWTLDLTDAEAVLATIGELRPRVIVHLASLVGRACEDDPAAAEAVNVGGTAHLFAAARVHGVERFVFASTAAVYGDTRHRPVVETDDPLPGGVYARSKLRAEETLASGDDAVAVDVLRVFNVYGPEMRDSLIARLQAASAEDPVTLHGLDGFVRDYVHSSDVARALLGAAADVCRGYRVLNVGSGVPRSNRDLWDALPPTLAEAVVAGPEVSSYSCADISAIRRELSWLPREPWEPFSSDSQGPPRAGG